MDVAALSKLLEEAHEAAAERGGGVGGHELDLDTRGGAAAITPATMVAPAAIAGRGAASARESKAAADPSAIWGDDEVPNEDDIPDDGPSDGRPRPEFDIKYTQRVGAEDVFLGMSEKSPSSIDCDHIVVKVKFPGARARDLNLDVRKQHIVVESKTHKLATYLPLPVRHNDGKAQFDVDTGMLTVSLPVLKDSPL